MFKLTRIDRSVGRTARLVVAAAMLTCAWACGGSPLTAPVVIQGLRITAPSSIEASAAAQLSAVTLLSDGTTEAVAPGSVRWSTSDPNVGDISTLGLLSGLKTGVTIVRGSYQQWTSDAIEVTVKPTGSMGPRITLGQTLEGALIGTGFVQNVYTLTAPSDGTLIVNLTWTPDRGAPELYLEMYVDDASFRNSDNSSPLIVKVRVVAGRTYRVKVQGGSPWDYGDLNLPFVLATSMESPDGI